MEDCAKNLKGLEDDIQNLKAGRPVMSCLNHIDVRLYEVPAMTLLSLRRTVLESDYSQEYRRCFGSLAQRIRKEHLTMTAPPMVLFHEEEFSPFGLDTEFAFPVKERVTGTRDFKPGLCLKTVLKGAYSALPSVYARQMEWAGHEGYESSGPLFEVYITDPSRTTNESALVTEVYYPVRKKASAPVKMEKIYE